MGFSCMKLMVPELSFPDTEKNRFYSRVKIPNINGCMEWFGGNIKKKCYGGFHGREKKFMTAHRYSYQLFVGKIPEGICVLHKCDNPPCVNPEHLFLGTQQDNAIDMRSKNRGYSTAGENHGRSVLSLDSVKRIRNMYTGKRGELTSLGKIFNVSSSTVHGIVKNKTWRNI